MQYATSCTPARIAAGGSGTVAVVMVLGGSAVVPASAAPVLAAQPTQGPLTIGAPRLQPAGPARVSAAFRGEAVYDVYAVFEVPFAVAADASPGAQPVLFDLGYELYDDRTGARIGRFEDRVTAQVVIDRVATAARANVPPSRPGVGAGPVAPAAGEPASPAPAGNPWLPTAGGMLLAGVSLLLVAAQRGRVAKRSAPSGSQKRSVRP